MPPSAARTPLSHLEVDLLALSHNAGCFAAAARDARAVVCGVVKKNAYGLGATTIARRLATAGCGMLAVYGLEEAAELADAGLTLPTLVLTPVRSFNRTDALYRALAAGRLHPTLNDPDQARTLDTAGRALGLRIPVHLHVDTGMSRGGLSNPEFAALLAEAKQRTGLRIAGVMTHLATADNDPAFADAQVAALDALLDQHRDKLPADVLVHVANSYGVLRRPAFVRSLIRPGLGLYGYAEHNLAEGPRLQPFGPLRHVVRWVSRLIHVQRYADGTPVGYGSTWTTTRDSVLGLVPVGYGDGYPVALSNKSSLRLLLDGAHHDCPLRGRVNMDQVVIDLTDVVDADTDLSSLLHRPVEVIGTDPTAPHALPNLADLAQTHCYELLCRLNPRLPRRYLDER